MKKMILFFTVILMLVLMLASTQVFAFDLGNRIGLGSNTIVIDGHVMIGKLYDVESNTTKDYHSLNISTKRSEYYFETEIGMIVANVFRPFFKYEGLHPEGFDKRQVGADAFLLNWQGSKLGIRASYNDIDTHFDRQEFWFAGTIFKF